MPGAPLTLYCRGGVAITRELPTTTRLFEAIDGRPLVRDRSMPGHS